MYVVLCQPKQKKVMSTSSLLLMITQEMVAYLMRRKFEAFEKFKEFRAEVENQLGKCIKAIWSDRDGEYLLGDFKDYLTQNGIVSQLTAPGTP